MNIEEKLLINICQCYLNGDRLSLPDGIDWKNLYHLAKNHNLIGICHCVFNTDKTLSVPDNVRRLYKEKFFDLIFVYNMQSAAINDIRECFTANEIPFIFFKGSELRDLYPVPESRSMGDIDVLVRECDRNKARTALKNINFDCYAPNGTVREYSRNNYILEVHTKIISEFGDNAFDDAFDNAVFSGFEGRFDSSYHLAYLIAHIAHHFKFYGAGLKMVLDIAVMLSKSDIDIDKALAILSRIGLDTFAKEILSVTYHIFKCGIEYNKNTEKTEEYLLSCGAFGTLNDNKGAIIARRDLEQGKSISPFSTKLRLAFPSYSRMKNIPYIRFIEGRPWLTPYAWCYRFIYNFKNHKDFTKKTIKDIDEASQALAKEELRYFEEIGLI